MGQFVLALISGALLIPGAFAQDTSSPSSQADQGAAPAATGVDTPAQLSENPPLSGLDEPAFEPRFGTRSYLAPSLQLSEAIDSNAFGSVSRSSVTEETRLFGAVDLQKLWKVHPFDVNYVGGIAGYNGSGTNFYQVHSLAATQRFLWRTGQFAIRDAFSYLPEGTFGFGSFGGVGGFNNAGGNGLGSGGGGIAGGGGNGIVSGGQFGSIGNEPRITNVATLDVTQYLSPRSSVVLIGSFENTNFVHDIQGFLNSQATIGQAGYNYQISRKDQVAVFYAHEELHFPTVEAGSANINLWQLMYGHRISGRLDLRLSAGPQWVHTHEEIPFIIFLVPVNSSFITTSARAALTYHVSERTNFHLDYMHYINTGSGFFAGAKTDAVTFGAGHSLARRWIMTVQAGYSHSSSLLTTTATVANNAKFYSYGFAGITMRRQFSPHLSGFGNYQYNAFGVGAGFCDANSPGCSRSYGRQVFQFGLTWTPRPIRLD